MGCLSGGGGGTKTTVAQAPNWTPEQANLLKQYISAILPQAFQGGGLAYPSVYTGQQYLPGTAVAGTAAQPATEGYWQRRGVTGGRRRRQGAWIPGTPGVAAQPGTPGTAISDILSSYLAPMSPMQTQGLQTAQQQIPGAYQTAQGGLQDVISNLSGGYQADPALMGQLSAGYQADPALMGQLSGIMGKMSTGGIQDVFAPIYGQAQNLWQQQIMPQTMERFAGMGAAMGGGAQSALAREGQNLSTNLGATLAPLYLQSLLGAGNLGLGMEQLGQGAGQLNLQSLLGAGNLGLGAGQLNLATQTSLPGILGQYAGMPAQEAQSLLGFGGFEQGQNQAQLDMMRQIWGSAQPYSNQYLNLLRAAMPTGAAYSSGMQTTQNAPGFGQQLLTGMGTNLAGSLGGSLTGLLGGAASGIGGLLGGIGSGIGSLIGMI